MLFRDRTEAGKMLAAKLTKYAGRDDVQVLALPRGGVPVAYEVAHALQVPLDVFLVRKLGVPGHEELAMGALANGGIRVLDESMIRALGISDAAVNAITSEATRELQRRRQLYVGDRRPPNIRGRTAILVDDGLATGSTMRAAIAALRQQSPARIVVAVPVGAAETCAEFRTEADETVCAVTPEPFLAVGVWYGDFTQTTDQEVRALLRRAAEELPKATGSGREEERRGAEEYSTKAEQSKGRRITVNG